MFRPQVFRRSFSLFRRTPTSAAVSSAARNGHDAVRIQTVRIRKRFITKSRLAATAVVVVGLCRFLEWLNEEIEDDEEPQLARRFKRPRIPHEGANDHDGGRETTDEEEFEYDDDDDEEEEDEDEEDTEGLIFFPTGFSRPRPRTFYRGSDPEWQTFIRLAPDRQRMDKIRGELVTMVRDLARKNRHLALHLGNIDPKKGLIWIEVTFPDGPPIEYERPGIELTDHLTFRKTSRPVDQVHHQKLENALMPTAAANFVVYDIKRRIFAWGQHLKKSLGLEESAQPTTAQNLLKRLPAPSITPTSPTQTPASTPADNEKQATPPWPSLRSNPALEKLGLTLPDPMQTPTMDLFHMRMWFRKIRKPLHIEPPRGTFVVSGLVEVIGDKAKMTIDVVALYDPSLAKYVHLGTKVRSLTPYKQRPKGGP